MRYAHVRDLSENVDLLNQVSDPDLSGTSDGVEVGRRGSLSLEDAKVNGCGVSLG